MAKTKWIEGLTEKGYRYILKVDEGNTFFASKAIMKKDGSFPDNSNWDEFELEDGEAWDKRKKLKEFYYIGNEDKD